MHAVHRKLTILRDRYGRKVFTVILFLSCFASCSRTSSPRRSAWQGSTATVSRWHCTRPCVGDETKVNTCRHKLALLVRARLLTVIGGLHAPLAALVCKTRLIVPAAMSAYVYMAEETQEQEERDRYGRSRGITEDDGGDMQRVTLLQGSSRRGNRP